MRCRWNLLQSLQFCRQWMKERGEVEEKIFEKKSLANLYDPFLAVYNVAVHLLANKMGLTNTFQAFVSASVLSGFCLNFPKQLFQKIDIPDLFRSDRTTHGRARRLADQCDRGFLYVVLLEYAKPSELDDPEAWLEATLKQGGFARHQHDTEVGET